MCSLTPRRKQASKQASKETKRNEKKNPMIVYSMCQTMPGLSSMSLICFPRYNTHSSLRSKRRNRQSNTF